MKSSAWENNLQTRPAHKIKDCLKESSPNLILQTPCDLGVIRNGGKRGAKHGPQALLNPFQSLNVPKNQGFSFKLKSFQAPSNDPQAFERVQKEECQFFEKNLDGVNFIHLGGGHDHVYPFARALHKLSRPLIIINIDAHLDTRPDNEVHSGTPFRQLYKELKKDLHLLQVGIHPFANSPENLESMGTMKTLEPIGPNLDSQELKKQINSWLASVNQPNACLLLSVDCDGLDASYMPAVSAPNHRGLGQAHFQGIFESCQSFWSQSKSPAAFGLYEYNPIFDNLSQQGARFLASYMHDFFIKK